MLSGADLRADETLEKHADWVDEFSKNYTITVENIDEIIEDEIGKVFSKVLEDAGVYKRNEEGKRAFLKFVDCVNEK
jgi:UDPglucose--hexose-1-phosphate uridylyltransferase